MRRLLVAAVLALPFVLVACDSLLGLDGLTAATTTTLSDAAVDARSTAPPGDAGADSDATTATIDASPDADAALPPHDGGPADSAPPSCAPGGESCRGTCLEGGRCLAALVTGQIGVAGIIATDADVFWFTSASQPGGADTVMRLSKAGGAPVVIAPTDPSVVPHELLAMAVDSNYAYFSSGFDLVVYIAPLDGGPSQAFLVDAGPAISLAVDSESLYWATYASSPDPDAGEPVDGGSDDAAAVNYSGSVSATPLDGGPTRSLYSTPTAGIAIDSTDVYAATESWGTVVKIPKDGGAVVTLAADWNNNVPWSIAVNSNGVFWCDFGTGWVNGLTTDGGLLYGGAFTSGMQDILGPFFSPAAQSFEEWGGDIAADSANAYWLYTGVDAGAVMEYVVANGENVTLASGLPSPSVIAVDSTSVYWADSVNNTIWQLSPK